MTDYKNASADELQAIISNAEKALKNMESNRRKAAITQIKELAASIGMMADIYEADKKTVRKTAKVAIKYRDPNNAEHTWTGRGVMPKWLRVLLNEGHDRSEFEV
jgi:DNA-binding protein H-NS